MNKNIISTHISEANSSQNFTYKDKSRWPKLRNFIYDVPSLFNSNVFFYKEDLLKSKYISKTYKERIKTLDMGESCIGNSNGGGRYEYFRVLTQEDIDLLLKTENLQNELINAKEQLKKIAPNLIQKINDLNNSLVKLNKILVKENLR